MDAPSTLDLSPLAWSAADLPTGLTLLVNQAGLAAWGGKRPSLPPPTDPLTAATLDRWFTSATQQLGCQSQPLEYQFSDLPALVRRTAPAVLQLPHQEEPRFLLLLKNGRHPTLLRPDHTWQRVNGQHLTTTLQTQAAGPAAAAIEQLLVRSQVAPQRLPRAKAALIAQQLSDQRLAGCWLLKPAPHNPTWRHLHHHHLPRYLLILILLSLLLQLFTLITWRYIGEGVFLDQFDQAGLTAWALILLTTIPFQLLAQWGQINLTLNLGRFARTRMLQGILNLNPSDIRHMGAGQFLERVMQTESFQALLLTGGFAVLNAFIQLLMATIVLQYGAGGLLHSLLLATWIGFTILVSIWYAVLFNRWRDTYRALTNDLVERMVAHRTRLAQEGKETWHLEEDEQLDQYHTLTHRMDRLQLLLSAVLNRGWFLVGLAGIALPFIDGRGNEIQLAISIGGILLASAAFGSLTAAILTIANIHATWRDVRPIFEAANTIPAVGTLPTLPTAQAGKPLVVARQVQFAYHTAVRPTLHAIDLTIYPGDRLLLEGPSGGGKSTLASLLVGLQQPDSGLLLLHGLDQPTLGLGDWRQRAVSAPQFHENHVLTETFGFNLLMGRRWPASREDLQEAAEICHELGLGDLLQRMPGGMMQMVGESGWQLSHGERSRLFIARALLQEADLIILDESFAALDPTNLERAIRCVLKRAPTVLVIAHP